MSDTSLRMRSATRRMLVRRHSDWSALWGGVFIFAAIWAVFESLAVAIFWTPTAPFLLGKGLGIWTVVLTVVAMYIAGLETARLTGISMRHEGLVHGLMMFGLTFVSITGLFLLAGPMAKYVAGTAANAQVIWGSGLTSGKAWTAFLALFLGCLAAIGGAAAGVQRHDLELRQASPLSPAA